MSPISATTPAMSGLDRITRPGGGVPIELPSLGQTSEVATVHAPTETFAGMLGRMISDVNAKQNAAGQAVAAMQAGQGVPLHQAVIAMEEANVSFQLMVEVRNKLLESYQEIMKLQM